MKIENTTDIPTWLLRRMLGWCCHQLKLPVRSVKQATFRNRLVTGRYSGHATHSGSVVVSLWPIKRYPSLEDATTNRPIDLVYITAHELAHILQKHTRTRQGGGWGGSETATDWHANPVVEAFRAQRDQLLEAWGRPPVLALRQQCSAVDLRRMKAVADLARWERKLKLAKTKVTKLRARVAYYAKHETHPGTDHTAQSV